MNDPTLQLAKTTLKKHFINKAGNPIKTPFYQSQLEVLYENDYFPWVVGRALRELVDEKFLGKITRKDIPNMNNFVNIQRITFFVNNEVLKTAEGKNKIVRRAYKIAYYVNKYSDPKNSKMIGNHLESLVKAELQKQGFKIEKIHANEYGKKKWIKTEHNLDFIASRIEPKLVIGVEVKNTLNIMQPKEIDIKIDICDELGIVPVFAVRWMKPYIECIRLQGGFSWVFKTQMYPLGQENFTKLLYDKLSSLEKKNTKGKSLQFPITVRTEIPEKTSNIFKSWIERVKHEPPQIDRAYRCGKIVDEKIKDHTG